MTATDTDVLVVGAGPTGLMLALQLVRRGIRVAIVDRHAGAAMQSRALGVQARTLEIYDKLGIADRALELGKIGTGANLWSRGRRMARVPLGDAGKTVTRYPYILILGQDDNERIMGEKLNALGVSVQWNTELVALAQDADKVTATLKLPGGDMRQMTAAYVGGCDGAHSAVRELSGITFPGAPYEHVFFVADTQATGTMVPDEVNVYLFRKGFHLLFPMRGEHHWRIVGMVPEELRGRCGLTIDDVMPTLRHEAGDALAVKSCTWFSTYRIHHRAASRFRDRRAFVLGDAAHIHSPVGAQGMNTGLQDAYNLAWKLARVVKGESGAALLDSYEAERLPVAQRLLDTTDRGFRLVVSDTFLAGLLRTEILARVAAFAMQFKRTQKLAFDTVSQTGIAYRGSSLSVTGSGLPAGAPRAGDRFPWLHLALSIGGPPADLFRALDDTVLHLLVFGQALLPQDEESLGRSMRIHAIPDDPANMAELARAGVPSPSFYLLRPDGHVGCCGVRLDAAAISHYLSERLSA